MFYGSSYSPILFTLLVLEVSFLIVLAVAVAVVAVVLVVVVVVVVAAVFLSLKCISCYWMG